MKNGDGKKRDDIIAKIRALFAKTVENGCTEAEAIQAAEVAARLMGKYDLEMGDLDVKDESVIQSDFGLDPVYRVHLKHVSAAVSTLCGVRTWGDGTRNDRQVFFGLPHDVEVAVYLMAICERAMRTEHDRHAREWVLYNPNRKSKLTDSFLKGMSDRLCEKLRDLAWARHRATGNALVPVKDALIRQAMDDNGIELEFDRMGNKRDVDPRALRLGREAADKIRLDPAIKGSGVDVDGMLGA